MTENTQYTSRTILRTKNKKQGKGKCRSASVFQTILTPDDGQYRPKHVVYRRQSENDAELVIKVLKFVLYLIIEF
jgi:hypothetical protein